MKFRFQRKYLSIPYLLFLSLFVVIPIFLIVYYAFSDASGALSLDSMIKFFTTPSKWNAILVSFFISIQTTIICLVIAYPLAYFLASKKYNKNVVLVMLFVMPTWINFVLRTAATRDLLFWIGINGGTYPYTATSIGMVYNFLPFTVLPLYSTMLKIDNSLNEAASDLGANPFQVFITSILPQSLPGIISAISMVFMPVMSSYVISDALSEGNIYLIGNSIYLNFTQNQWNDGSFMALFLLLCVLVFMLFTREKKNLSANKGVSTW